MGNFGNSLVHLGRLPEAVRWLEKAADLEPTADRITNLFDTCVDCCQFDKVQEIMSLHAEHLGAKTRERAAQLLTFLADESISYDTVRQAHDLAYSLWTDRGLDSLDTQVDLVWDDSGTFMSHSTVLSVNPGAAAALQRDLAVLESQQEWIGRLLGRAVFTFEPAETVRDAAIA